MKWRSWRKPRSPRQRAPRQPRPGRALCGPSLRVARRRQLPAGEHCHLDILSSPADGRCHRHPVRTRDHVMGHVWCVGRCHHRPWTRGGVLACNLNWIGMALALTSAVLATAVIIGGSHAMKSSDSLGVTCYMMLSAAAGLVAICIIQGDLPLPVTLRGWAGFGGVSSWFLARSSPWRRAAGRWRSQSKSLGLHASKAAASTTFR